MLLGEVVLVKTDSWVRVVQNVWEDLASLLYANFTSKLSHDCAVWEDATNICVTKRYSRLLTDSFFI